MSRHTLNMSRINILILLCQAAVICGLARGLHFDYVKYVLITTGLWLVYMFLEARYRLYMNNFVRAMMGITLVNDSFLGYYFDLYLRSPASDRVLHLFAVYSLSLFTYILVVQFQKNAVSRSLKFILVLCLGISIGTVNEIIEFSADIFSHSPVPNQIGLLDTDLDLVSDVLGAVCAAGHVTFRNFINQS